jgi:predicted MFS family arabinose efflux permease
MSVAPTEPEIGAVLADEDPSKPASRSLRRRLSPLTVAVSLLGFMLWVPIEKLFMTAIGFDAASIGVMVAAYAALVPIIEIPSGILADRWSRRGVLAIAAGALALTSLIAGLSYNVPTYIASALVLAVYFAMYSGTMDAVVYDTVLEEIGASDAFEQQIGRVRLVESVALVAGALVGGVVAELTSLRLTYLLTVPFAAVAILVLLRFVEPQLHKQESGTSLRTQVSLTYGAIARTPRLVPIVVLTLLASLLLQSVFEFGPLWLIAEDAAAGLYGPYWAGLMATLGLGGLLAGRIPLENPVVLAIVAAVMLLASLALTLSSLPIIIGAQVVLALLLLIASIRATQLMHDSVPSTIRTGVASGVGAIGWMCFLPFAFGLGLLSRNQGVQVAAWMLVVATFLCCIALAVVARRRPLPPESTAEALTTRLLRDVRRCLLERRNEVEPLDCNEAVEIVTEFLEGSLDPHAELQFTNHVRGCLGCSRYLDQVRQTIEELRRLPEQERLPSSTRASLLATFRVSLEPGGAADPAS